MVAGNTPAAVGLCETPEVVSRALPWLLRLRWWAVVGQVLITAVAVLLFQFRLPMIWVGLCIFVTLSSNILLVVFQASLARRPVGWTFIILCLDTVLLTALLFLAGGAHNPFSVFYLLHVALAALILPSWTVWSILALSAAGFSLLFVSPFELHCGNHSDHSMTFDLHLQGMLVALVLCGIFLAYFVGLLRRELREVRTQLDCVQKRAERGNLAMAMGAFAAGSAHELATPISTIAVAVSELLDREKVNPSCGECLEDFVLIRDQVRRCQEILKRLHRESLLAENTMTPAETDLGVLSEQLRMHFPKGSYRLLLEGFNQGVTIACVPAKLTTALQSLIKNALQASPDEETVRVTVEVDSEEWKIFVRDSGTGLNEEDWEHFGQPFFTTKPAGQGSGLGVFLAKMLCESMGVELRFEKNMPRGLVAILSSKYPED